MLIFSLAWFSASMQTPGATPSSAGQQEAGSLFSSFKIGAGNLMKNVKEASSKVVETVSA